MVEEHNIVAAVVDKFVVVHFAAASMPYNSWIVAFQKIVQFSL